MGTKGLNARKEERVEFHNYQKKHIEKEYLLSQSKCYQLMDAKVFVGCKLYSQK